MQPPDTQRMNHILDYCREIEKTIDRYGRSFEIFDKDPDYQRSVTFSILQIGELSVGLSPEYKADTSAEMQWTAIRGMRNLVAHNYGSMSREIIWETAIKDIPSLKEFCERQLRNDKKKRDSIR